MLQAIYLYFKLCFKLYITYHIPSSIDYRATYVYVSSSMLQAIYLPTQFSQIYAALQKAGYQLYNWP